MVPSAARCDFGNGSRVIGLLGEQLGGALRRRFGATALLRGGACLLRRILNYPICKAILAHHQKFVLPPTRALWRATREPAMRSSLMVTFDSKTSALVLIDMQLGYSVVIVEDACASISAEMHDLRMIFPRVARVTTAAALGFG